MTRIPYETYIRVAPDGRIVETVAKIGEAKNRDFIKLDDDQTALLRRETAHGLLWRDGLVLKPLVRIVADRASFRADGRDMVSVRLEGVPEDHPQVKVVAGDSAYQLPRGEPLEITADTFGTIRVGLREPLLRAEDIMLIAELPPDEG